MTRRVQHLVVEDVIAIHEETMQLLGQAPTPLLRAGDLESALYRTRMAEQYDAEADILRLAALLAVGISQAQAFLDGNKRTAFVALVTFLRANGYTLTRGGLEASEQLTRVAERTGEREAAERDFEAWLRGVVAPVVPLAETTGC